MYCMIDIAKLQEARVHEACLNTAKCADFNIKI